jgi:hypothetical protein
MSKTYRRTQKGQKRDWLPEIRKDELSEHSYWGYRFKANNQAIEWVNNNPHRRKDVDDWFYWMTTPSHWNHDFSTVPRRAKEQKMLREVLKAEIDPDDASWPLSKKPHKYYW